MDSGISDTKTKYTIRYSFVKLPVTRMLLLLKSCSVQSPVTLKQADAYYSVFHKNPLDIQT